MSEEGQLCLDLGVPINSSTCDNYCWFSSETAFLFQCFDCIYKLIVQFSPLRSVEEFYFCLSVLLMTV